MIDAAKGQVWTGEDAKARGLVDELGGYDAAIRLAREAAGIAAEAQVELRLFPERRDRFKALIEANALGRGPVDHQGLRGRVPTGWDRSRGRFLP